MPQAESLAGCQTVSNAQALMSNFNPKTNHKKDKVEGKKGIIQTVGHQGDLTRKRMNDERKEERRRGTT